MVSRGTVRSAISSSHRTLLTPSMAFSFSLYVRACAGVTFCTMTFALGTAPSNSASIRRRAWVERAFSGR